MSWAQWRGYGTVVVRRKTVQDGVLQATDRARTKYVLFRGMNGDKFTPQGGVRPQVRIATKEITVAANEPLDDIQFRGQVAERSDLDGTGLVELRREYFLLIVLAVALR